jgi:hypothetical protein
MYESVIRRGTALIPHRGPKQLSADHQQEIVHVDDRDGAYPTPSCQVGRPVRSKG